MGIASPVKVKKICAEIVHFSPLCPPILGGEIAYKLVEYLDRARWALPTLLLTKD